LKALSGRFNFHLKDCFFRRNCYNKLLYKISLSMSGKKHITLKILLFLITTDLLETVAQFCFKKTALPRSEFEVKSFLDALFFVKEVAFSPYLWAGFLSALAIFIIWCTILSRLDLSVAVPVASFSYITIPVISALFFHESIPPLRWAGISFILTGVMLVSLSSKHKPQTLQ